MRRFTKRVFTVVLMLSIFAAGCQSAEQTRPAPSPSAGKFSVVVKAQNGEVSIPKRPARIVSLSPTATEMLFAIGAGKQVVAADSLSTYPLDAPKTDLSAFQPNVEAVATYKPDLVVISDDLGDIAASLKAAGILMIHEPAAKTLTETYDEIKDLGLATGRVQEAGDLVATMKSEIKSIVAATPKPDLAPTYYYELDTTLFSATSKTFIGQILGLLGLKNIADEGDRDGGGFPQLSAEYIVQADPDLIFLADTKCCGQTAGTVAARPGWGQIRAVKNRRVTELDDDIASRWGPRIVDLLRLVAKDVRELQPVKS